MKTIINNTDFKNIELAFKNPFGIIISNNPEVRNAVAKHAKSIIENLHAEKNKNK